MAAVDRLASDLLQAAASLLVLQPALQGKVAQAFLKVLQNLRAGRAEGLLESYGSFYRELLTAGYSSWQDCLLDEVCALVANTHSRHWLAGRACVSASSELILTLHSCLTSKGRACMLDQPRLSKVIPGLPGRCYQAETMSLPGKWQQQPHCRQALL